MLEPGKHQLQVVEKFRGLPAALIGDSMGTGKTLSAILMELEWRRKEKGDRRTLIVCQKGGLSVWKWHLEDQGVDPARILVIDPQDREPMEEELRTGAQKFDYYVLHWDALRHLRNIVKPEQPETKIYTPSGKKSLKNVTSRQITWDLVIADEVQYAKNRNAERTKILKRIKTRRKLGCSGTPADDKPHDFWSILNWLYPKEPQFRSYWRFYDNYIDWHLHPKGGYRMIDGIKNLDQFHEMIAPFYIRRKLTDVVDSMPSKTHGKIWVDLTPRQIKDYDNMQKFQVARIGEMREELLAVYKIEMYIRLQQMMLGTVTELDWTEYDKSMDRFGPDTTAWPKGTRKGPQVVIGEPSPKLDVVMEKVEEALESGEQIVVFSYFQAMADMVEARCKKEKIPVSKVTGRISSQTVRDAAVANFQSGKTKVFAGTIGAAGTSITLTAANTLIFTDRSWNPSKNEQAEDRIWRIGQKNACRIWDIVARDTIDDGRLQQIWRKARWVNEFVNLPTHLNGAVLR